MITIVSATNRLGSNTDIVAQEVFNLIGQFTDEEVNLVKMSEFSSDFIHPKMYDAEFQDPELSKLQDEQFVKADKWIMLSPEYNGSYSGYGKLFVDAMSIREKEATFRGKKLALIGVAAGRAGNLRGLDHLTTSLNYMGMIVYPNRLPLSLIHTLIKDGELTEDIKNLLSGFLEGFVKF